MSFFRKYRTRILLLLLVGLAAIVLVVLHSVNFSLSEQEIAERFAEANVTYTEHLTQGVHWVESGNPEGPLLLFIHGSPGSWDNFIEFLYDPELVETYRMISISRPGYGGDSKGTPTSSLSDQAAAAGILIPETRKATIIGHSMGAPIAVRLAMDYPDKVKRLVLLSAAVDPELEKIMFIQRIANRPLVAWMLPETVVVCNRELIPLKKELLELIPMWKDLRVPITAVHGMEDSLVPVENVDFLKANISDNLLDVRLIPQADHFIPWSHFENVKEAILNEPGFEVK